ncbi:MAG: superinfection immunity protein [Ruminococcus sp.]|nr:superinfection immunity protein [Ruminococcus sp.]
MFYLGLIAIIVTSIAFILSVVKLTKKSEVLQDDINIYGVNKKTKYDKAFKKIYIRLIIISVISCIITTIIICVSHYSQAKEIYNALHTEKFTSILEEIYDTYEADSDNKDLSGYWQGIETFGEDFYDESVMDYFFENPHPIEEHFSYPYYNKLTNKIQYDFRPSWAGILKENGYIDSAAFLSPNFSCDIPSGFGWEVLTLCGIPLGFAILFILYMYPTKVARRNSHEQTTPIAWLNAIFGCTIIGWIAMLIWANSGKSSKTPTIVQVAGETNQTAADKIKDLKSLLDQNIISQEEFETKRKELLDKM